MKKHLMYKEKTSKIYHYIRCIPKTLFFNFYYLSFSQAIKLPILINHRTKFLSLGGRVYIHPLAKFGKIKLGFGQVEIADNKYSRFIWNVNNKAEIHLGEHIKIGTGSKIHVQGKLSIGSETNFTGETTIICNKEISFGNDCLVSWQTLFMDSDLHKITSEDNEIKNPDKAITIENNVWIGARSTLTKGVYLKSNSVIACTSTITNSFEEYSVIGGNPAKVIANFTGKKFHK